MRHGDGGTMGRLECLTQLQSESLFSLLSPKCLCTLVPAGKKHHISMEAIEENLMKRLFIKV